MIKIIVKFWSSGYTLYKLYEKLESNKSYKLAVPVPRDQINLMMQEKYKGVRRYGYSNIGIKYFDILLSSQFTFQEYLFF